MNTNAFNEVYWYFVSVQCCCLYLSSVVVCRCVWKIMLTYQVVFI